MGRKEEQVWENCRYAWNIITKSKYGCIHPKIMKIYPVVYVSTNNKINPLPPNRSASYANLHQRKLFHENPIALKNLLEIILIEFNLKDIYVKLQKEELKLPFFDEEKIIERALAGCRHCKFYERGFF